jgi:hypothetical protein
MSGFVCPVGDVGVFDCNKGPIQIVDTAHPYVLYQDGKYTYIPTSLDPYHVRGSVYDFNVKCREYAKRTVICTKMQLMQEYLRCLTLDG